MSRLTFTVSGPRVLEVRRLLRFACVGLSGFAINTLLLYVLTEHAGLYYLASSALATEAAIASNFILNHHWTFRGAHQVRSLPLSFARFNAVALGGLLITVASLFALTHVLGLHYLAANPVAIALASGWNYVMCRLWIWRGVPASRTSPVQAVVVRGPGDVRACRTRSTRTRATAAKAPGSAGGGA